MGEHGGNLPSWNLIEYLGAKVTFPLGPEFPKVPPAAAAAKSLQSCPTLCDPIDGSPPGSAIPGILQHWSGLPLPSPMHESEK